ncbi:hypothetical protein GQ55_7G281500 [Panicum hallii var. hallii]|uniref:Uncharacterized protein n=1 Tax=Panicum hallii var. hallii TaxID=1504633 RepID=A0A2T7CZV7_9POAL|nr:hypothetical protein GQ55_7G281500 [Panicum hallii var. hallii]
MSLSIRFLSIRGFLFAKFCLRSGGTDGYEGDNELPRAAIISGGTILLYHASHKRPGSQRFSVERSSAHSASRGDDEGRIGVAELGPSPSSVTPWRPSIARLGCFGRWPWHRV